MCEMIAGLVWEHRDLHRGRLRNDSRVRPRLGLDLGETIAGLMWEHRGLARGPPRLGLDLGEVNDKYEVANLCPEFPERLDELEDG